MPGGSAYPGAAADLDRYRSLVARHAGPEVLGAKNPYTSVNGWMTSFLDPDGMVCLRLAADERAELIAHGGAAVEQYGRNMPDFASLPRDASDAVADAWFERSWHHSTRLAPK